MIPRELDICVSNQCNMRCGYCYSGGMPRARVQKLDARRLKSGVLQYLKSVSGGSIEKFSISGGEPLLDKGLLAEVLPWLRDAAGPSTMIECFTNGLLLDERAADMFIRSGVRLRISLDGAAPSHNLSRICADGSPSFARVTANLLAIPAAKRRHMGICTTVAKGTAGKLSSNIRFLASLGAGDLGISFAVQEAWGRSDLDVLRRELRKTARFLAGEGSGAFLVAPRFGYKRLSSPGDFCLQGEVSLGPDGVFYPCSLISASAVTQDPRLKARYACGDWRSGLDEARVERSRRAAFRKIRSAGNSLYLACLLCVYYKSLLEGLDLPRLLKSGERMVRILAEEGMGSEDLAE